MKNKESYTLLDMNVIEFENTDVIVTSLTREENEVPGASDSNT